jgi:hypothetical protein
MRDSARLLAVRFSAVLCLVLASRVLLAAAQLYTGSIGGAVTDPSGAVVLSAHVVATDMDKGFAFPGITDGAGRYLLGSSRLVTINGPRELQLRLKVYFKEPGPSARVLWDSRNNTKERT